ncbi:MAG: EF-Tu/IF-2/RF-3 family GTPase [Candidatus Thermoplasmatota archaeon]
MKHVTVGIFHDDSLGRELGKKGTASDILMFNKKTDECVYTFMAPFENKLIAKTQILSSIDAAIINCEQITAELGETLLLVDSLGITQGILLLPTYAETAPLRAIIKDTSLEQFPIVERNIPKIIGHLVKMNPPRDVMSPAVVITDHSFSVKGIGEVILGFVKQGVIKTHDTMLLLPANKDVMIRSIQMQDRDCDSATAGCRVGLAIKGATIEELKRGAVFSASDAATIDTRFMLRFTKNRFYQDLRKGVFHMTVGMQTVPITITELAGERMTIETEKPVSHLQNDVFILFDLNGKKLHHIGTGIVG